MRHHFAMGVGLGLVLAAALPANQGTPRPDLGQYLAVGSRLFQQEKFAEAATLFGRGAEFNPEHPIPHLARGHSSLAAGLFPQAAAALRRGVEILPDWPTSHIGMRSLQSKPEVLDRRLGELEALVKEQPDDPVASFLLGYARYWEGRKDEARRDFQRVLEAEPGHAPARAFLEALGEAEPPEEAEPPPEDGWLGK